MGNKHSGRRERPQWLVVETKVKDNVAVQVSELPLRVPRYSFKLGTAQFNEDTGEMQIGSRLTVFNVVAAAELLTEIGKKYVDKRADRINEIEAKKAAWQDKNTD